MTKKRKGKAALDFKKAFKYPFNRAKRMWNILWLLFPIFGWFALGGYGVRIVQEFSRGKFKELPEMKFGSDMKFGFFMFLKAIPFVLVYMVIISILETIPAFGGFAILFLEVLVVPILGINFINKETVGSYFEFEVVKSVFDNFKDYVVVMLKSLGLALIFVVMLLILVGLPALVFTANIFVADFYRRRVR
jgi:hypothetical protein